MLKDIEEYVVQNVGIAIVQEWDEKGNDIIYNAYVINLRETVLEGVLVKSNGYGTIEGEHRETSTLRHFLDTIEPMSYCKIEPIQHELFVLNNRFMLTYFENNKLYDKEFVFESNTIHPDHFKQVPFLRKPGILII